MSPAQNKNVVGITGAKEIALLETLINSMPDLLFGKDIQGRYLVCNDAFARLFVGLPKAKIIGKTDRELFSGKNKTRLEFILEKDNEVIKFGKDIKVEWKTKLANGKEVILETIKTQFKDEKGKLLGLVGVSRDITLRKKEEEEFAERMRQSELLNKVMVDREIKMAELKKEIVDLKEQFSKNHEKK